MKKGHIKLLISFGFALLFLFFGVNLFSLAMEVTENHIRLFGFILAILNFILCSICVILLHRFSQELEYDVLDFKNSERKKYVRRSINYFYFVMILFTLLLILLIVGLILFPSNEWYWRLYNGLTAITAAMIISYVPWFDIIKNKIWEANWLHLFIITIIMLISLISLFGLYLIL